MEKAILKTLAYADIFDYPLKKDELWLWLIEEKGAKKGEFEQGLEKLVEAGRCGQASGFYFLPEKEEIVKLRKKREKASKPKIEKAKKVAQILKIIPFIKLIGITGGLAQKNSDEQDDIDLFFITSEDRLWLTRGLVVLVLSLLGVYRRPQKIKDMICPNMLISKEALKMGPCDLFTAHEIAQVRPIFERDNAYQRFLKANLWAREFLPNSPKWRMENTKWRKKKDINYSLSIIHFGERLARGAQLWYMKKKKTTEVVTSTLIKFHPHDARERVLRAYRERLKRLGLS